MAFFLVDFVKFDEKMGFGAKIAYFCRFSLKVENLVENDPQKWAGKPTKPQNKGKERN